jgi:hypothetical protein
MWMWHFIRHDLKKGDLVSYCLFYAVLFQDGGSVKGN